MAASNNTKREGGNRKEEQKNSQSSGSQLTEARETFATLFELSKLLNTSSVYIRKYSANIAIGSRESDRAASRVPWPRVGEKTQRGHKFSGNTAK